MTDMLSGQMVEVAAIQRGTQATAAASIGDTVLYVDDVTDFDDAGGRLDITGVQYDYLTCDEPSSTITLASPLTDAVDEDDPVLVLAGSQVAIDRYAVVSIDSGGGDAVWVPLSYDQLWSIQAYDPPLPVLVSGDLSKVLDAPGATNIISADSVAGDPLAALINPNSVTTLGEIPASAAVGDICIIGSDSYVCTLAYDSDGTLEDNWTLATDPRTIALVVATATAVVAADNANENARTAQASADGKNTITYAASPPTSTSAGIIGDTWFVFTSGNISAQYKLTAAAGTTYTWSSMQITSDVIANLDVGKITGAVASFLEANITDLTSVAITSSTLTSSTITGTSITGGSFTGGSFQTTGTAGQRRVVIDPNGIVDAITFDGPNLGIIGNWYTVLGTFLGLRITQGGGGMYVLNGTTHFWHGTGGTQATPNSVAFVDTDGSFTSNGDITGFDLFASNQTGAAAGAAEFGPGGGLRRSGTSSKRYKTNIEPLPHDADTLLNLEPKAFLRRDPDLADPVPDVGVIAEDADELGLGDWVIYNPDGSVEGFRYEKWVTALQHIARNQAKQIQALEVRLAALEAKGA